MASKYPARTAFPQQASIVSRWLLDEASGNRADSVGSNTLTDNNTVAAGAGFVGSNARFDNSADFERGNSEYLSIADASQSGLDPATDFSISFWIRREETGTAHGLVSKHGGATAYYRIYTDTNTITFDVYDLVNSSFPSSTTSLAVDTWYHITCVFDASTRATVYVNGVKEGEDTSSVPGSVAVNTNAFIVGALAAGANTFADGLMQDVVFWSVALSDAEVTALYYLYTGNSKFFGLF